MKKIFYILVTVPVLLASCKKTPEPPVHPTLGEEVIGDNEIWYVSTDGKTVTPTNIFGFGANYTSTKIFQDGYEKFHGVMYFDNAVTTIPQDAFADCDLLRSVQLPVTVTSVGERAFKDCDSLFSVQFRPHGKVDAIKSEAFALCPSLRRVELPGSLNSIEDNAFDACGHFGLMFPPEVDKIPTFAENTFPADSVYLIRVPYDRVDEFKTACPSVSGHIMRDMYSDDVNHKTWTEYLPDEMPLSMMTIPGAHDAATWMASELDPQAPVLKDQYYKYDFLYDMGVRIFDLRLGLADLSQMEDFWSGLCYFWHGPGYAYTFASLNLISDDIADCFPTAAQFENSFLILEAQYETTDRIYEDFVLREFEYFVELLCDKYGADKFIAYNPNLRLKDVKGKVLLFVGTDTYTQDYSYINPKYSEIPINYRNSGKGPGGTITVYKKGEKISDDYPIRVQNIYEYDEHVQNVYIYKYEDIEHAYRMMAKEKSYIQSVNNLNATMSDHTSWPVSSYVNPHICDDLENGTKSLQTHMGWVYADFLARSSVQTFYGETFQMDGARLLGLLVDHNFEDVYFQY